MSLDIEINSKTYALVEDRDGTKVATRPVQEFVQPIRQTGRTRPEDVAAYESFVIPNLTRGFGRKRINSDSAFNPDEYRKFFDSTCDTRWMDSVYLPILAQASTSTGLERIRRSIHAKGHLWGGWSDETSTKLISHSYTGDTTTWTAGGQIAPQVLIDSKGSAANGTGTTLTISHTVSDTYADRMIVVFLAAGSAPSGVTFNGDALTQLDTQVNGSTGAHIWYRVAPDVATGNVVITFSGSTHAAATVLSLYNVDQSTPFGTAVKGTGTSTGAQPSLDVTTTVGDFVIDVVAGESSILSSVPGTDQNSMTDSASGGHAYHTATRKYAQRTTTTMSQTLTGSDAWAHVAAGVKAATGGGKVNILLDMLVHKNQMIALYAEGDSHYVARANKIDSLTADWSLGNGTQITTGLLDNVVTSGEDIDAGLLAHAGGELIAALWHESEGTITFYSSADAGNTWTDENIDIGSGNGPTACVVYPDIDGVDKLYLGTAEGIWLIDVSPSTWTFEFIHAMSFSTDNCRDMTIHQGAIWFAEGIDDSSPAPIYRMTVQGDSRVIESGYGLNFGDGVPDDLFGPVKRMKSSGDFLYISVGGSAASRNARLLCWNGNGWHHMHKHGTANKIIEWIDIGTEDDGKSRLHFAARVGDTESAPQFLGYANTNPSSVTGLIKRADLSGTASGHIELPYYDFGIPQESKLFTAVHVIADNLTSGATSSDVFVEVEYGVNGAAKTTDLGNFTSGTSKVAFASGAGVSGKNIGFTLKLNRGSTNTDTPALKDLVVEGYVVPTTAYEHNLTIDLEQTATDTGQSVETVISNLQTLISTVTLVDFKFGQVSKKVAVDRDRSSFSFGINSWESSGAPNALANRTGTATLTLIEKVAS